MRCKSKTWVVWLIAGALFAGAPIARANDSVSARSSSVSVADRNVLIALLLAATFWGNRPDDERRVVAPRPQSDRDAAPELDPNRKISEQDCTQPVVLDGGNLRCK